MSRTHSLESAPRNPSERSLWFNFMAIRGGCAVVALLAALNFSLGNTVLVVLCLVLLLAGAESFYKSTLVWLRVRTFQLAKRRKREAAEQIYLEKLRQARQAQQEAAEKYFDSDMMTLGKGATGENGETAPPA